MRTIARTCLPLFALLGCAGKVAEHQAKPPQLMQQTISPGRPGYVGPCTPNMPMPNGCVYAAVPPRTPAGAPQPSPGLQPVPPQPGAPQLPPGPQPAPQAWQWPTGWFPQPGQMPPQPQPVPQPGQNAPPTGPVIAQPQPPVGLPNPFPSANRPLLAPLVGSPAMQQEVRAILTELIAQLGPDNRAKVDGIPLRFEAINEVNAYAGCESGASFMAGTEGFLQTAMALADTAATDEMFGTKTYDSYTATIIPQILNDEKSSPSLPTGIVPPQYAYIPQRQSRAREIFGDIVAFTFGHELGHHYLGHTGCANGAARDAATRLGTLLGHVVPVFGQLQETQADSSGTVNALDSGKFRRPNYRWSERGGVLLLDFFARLERAASGRPFNPLNPLNLLRTHPNPTQRIPAVQGVARDWYGRNPGVQ